MQVGRDPIGPVCLDRAQCVDYLADRCVPLDRAHAALLEREGEPIDMDCARAAVANHGTPATAAPRDEHAVRIYILRDARGRPSRPVTPRSPPASTPRNE